MALKVGDPAPDFSATSEDGTPLRLKDYRGRKLVLYFYPMDESPGCTKQACSLRDHNAEITRRGAAILGVSGQGADAHARFVEHHRLNFPLLVDQDQKVGRAYEAIGSGLFSVARAMTGLYRRITYVIDERGRIAHIIDDPDTADHGEQVLALL